MGRHDTSKAGEIRLLAERLRRRAREMKLPNYVEMMERAAQDLDAEARSLEEAGQQRPRLGRHLDIIV
ncbi:MAG: hypothetical protein WDN01_11665 [Rhizomicrobium sp.]